MRQKDQTVIKCQLCDIELTAAGMPSHLYHKHNKMSSEQYAEKFGEFRQKHLFISKRKEESSSICQICNQKLVSHKSLLQHISSVHKVDWKDYFVKYFFNGVHPLCKCGCGQKTKLLRHGKDDRKRSTYCREYLSGHNTIATHHPGYRTNTPEQRAKMRESAINRMKNSNSTFHQSGPSGLEKELQDFISSLVDDAVFNDKTILSGLEVDVLIPSKKIAIEFNGSFFHSDVHKKDKNYHLKKTKELASKGYNLIHIWECDWKHKKDIIKSTLTSILGKSSSKIYARQTEVREISDRQARDFLSLHHLQGPSVSKVRLGLFYNEELISVMTFSSLRRATGYKSVVGNYELVRFCSKKYTNVIGGASKLFKHFIKAYKPVSIRSFANRDWSNGYVYDKLGMNLIKHTTPGYFYVKSNIRYSRFQFQKHKLVKQGKDPDLSEYEIMTNDGYYRIWDCGNLLYEIHL